jgi:hypothetical protein
LIIRQALILPSWTILDQAQPSGSSLTLQVSKCFSEIFVISDWEVLSLSLCYSEEMSPFQTQLLWLPQTKLQVLNYLTLIWSQNILPSLYIYSFFCLPFPTGYKYTRKKEHLKSALFFSDCKYNVSSVLKKVGKEITKRKFIIRSTWYNH